MLDLARGARLALTCRVDTSTSLVSVLLVSLLAACGGKAFDSDPDQGGSDPGGTSQGGSGSSAGTAHGGSIGRAGSPPGGTGQGGSAGSECDAFADDPGTYINVVIYNQTRAPIYLGDELQSCGTSPRYRIADQHGETLPRPGSCQQSCQDLRRDGPIGCPTICAYPDSLALQPGEAFYTTWDGLFVTTTELPAQCLAQPEYGTSCELSRTIQPGSFTFSARAGRSLECLESPTGDCQACTATGNGGCTTPGSLITGEKLTARATVLLDGSYGVYGSLPAPAPALPKPGGDVPGAAAYRAVELIFRD
jgi:hypothetical protein